MKSLGQQLHEARIAKGWTPEAAAKVTKIKVERLLEIERDDYTKLAAPTYIRGFVRVYSRELGLNEKEILQQLDELCAQEDGESYVAAPPVEYIPQEIRYTKQFTSRKIGSWVIYLVLGIVVLVAGVGLYQRVSLMMSKYGKSKPTTQVVEETHAPRATPAGSHEEIRSAVPVAKAVKTDAVPAEPVAPPVVEATKGHTIILEAKEETWVRVRVTSGGETKILLDEVLPAGEKREFQGDRFGVKAMIPVAILVTYDGKKPATLGETRMPSEEIFIPDP